MNAVVASLLIDRHGCTGALVSADGEVLQLARASFEVRRWEGFHAAEPDAVLAAFAAVSKALVAQLGDAFLGAMGVCVDGPTALLLGSENRPSTPLLFGEGLALPRRAVPAEWQADARLTADFRRSVVRQVQARAPERAEGMWRLVSAGALVHHALCHEWVDSAPSPVATMPYDAVRGDYPMDEGRWLAVGIRRKVLPLLVPPGGVLGQVSGDATQRFGWPTATPMMATSDAFSCLVAGLKSNAAGWVVALGRGLWAGWMADVPQPERMQVQIIEPGDEPKATISDDAAAADEPVQPGEDGTIEASALHELVKARLDDLSVRLGPRRRRACFRLEAARDVFQEREGALGDALAPFEAAGPPPIEVALASSPLGAEGLRFVPGRTRAALVGLGPGHAPQHVVRAVFDGLCLELRRWRQRAGVTYADQPRVVLLPPWTVDTARLVADALGEPIFAWTEDPAVPALLGQALAISRDLALGTEGASPTLSLAVLEPTERAAAYGPHFALHKALGDAMAGVLV